MKFSVGSRWNTLIMPILSIIIPCYNEAENLSDIIRCVSSLSAVDAELEVVLVNNGSTDHTAAVLDAELPPGRYPHVRSITVERNQGYGHGILSGLREARGDFLAWTHADLQTDPTDVLRAWDLLRTGNQPERTLIKGKRCKRNPLDAFFTLGMSLAVWWKLGIWLDDINAQPKLFSRQLFLTLPNPPLDFSLDLSIIYFVKKNGYILKNIPVIYRKRIHGKAKGGGSLSEKWPLIKRTSAYISRLQKELHP